MGNFTLVKSPMKIHGRFYLSKKTPDYKMTHQLFTLFWIISNILTFHFYTFSVICTFYFYIAFEELTFYQKCSIKCVLFSLFYLQWISFWLLSLIYSDVMYILQKKLSKTLNPVWNKGSNILLPHIWSHHRPLCSMTKLKEHSREIC